MEDFFADDQEITYHGINFCGSFKTDTFCGNLFLWFSAESAKIYSGKINSALVYSAIINSLKVFRFYSIIIFSQ